MLAAISNVDELVTLSPVLAATIGVSEDAFRERPALRARGWLLVLLTWLYVGGFTLMLGATLKGVVADRIEPM